MLGRDYWNNMIGTARMLSEAQAVIGYRVLGMAGLWPVAPGETMRMTMEKAPAFAAAQVAAWQAVAAGSSPDRIVAAWLRPIGRRTRANEKRLSRR